jgi:isoleucyl-tRNA synthetase
MSKSKGNAVDPFEVMNQFGADALRFYFYSVNQPGLPKNFDIKDVEEIARNLLLRLWNTLVFFTTYVDQSSFKPSRARPKPKAVLDKWILARLDEVINEVTGGLDQLDTYDAAQNILKFVGDLSNWYLRRSRKRFFRNPKKSDEKEAYATLYYVLKQVVTLLAPFTPFMAEEMYQVLKIAKDPASVHLVRWPVVKKLTAVEKKILLQMQEVRTLVEEGLRLREEAGIRVRQPLGAIYTTTKLSAELSMILAEEINVEKVKKVAKLPSGKSIKKDKRIALETQLTDALKQEGLLREMIRFVQQKRKNLGLTVDDRAKIKWYSDDRKVQQLLRKRGADVANETLSTLSEGKDARWEKLEANSMAVYLQVAKK